MICINFSIQNITWFGHLLTRVNQVNSCFDPSCLSTETYSGCRNETCYFWGLFKLTGQSNGDYSHCILRSTMCWGEAFTYQTTALYCCSKNNLNMKSLALHCPFPTYPRYTQLQTIAVLVFIQVLLLQPMKSGTWLTPALTHSTRKTGKFSVSITEKEKVTAPTEEFSLNKEFV